MKESTTISKNAGCIIELIHRKNNPTVWIVKRWSKHWWFKKLVSADWFTDAAQALMFAERIRRDFSLTKGSTAGMEISRKAK